MKQDTRGWLWVMEGTEGPFLGPGAAAGVGRMRETDGLVLVTWGYGPGHSYVTLAPPPKVGVRRDTQVASGRGRASSQSPGRSGVYVRGSQLGATVPHSPGHPVTSGTGRGY